MSWYIAPSLEALRAEMNTRWPRRSRLSDGGIGDASHSSRTSDHNPDWTSEPPGVVRARDFTHDPTGGPDMRALSEALRQRCAAGAETRVRYCIFDGRVWRSAGGPTAMFGVALSAPYRWYPYRGPSPHTAHMHVSIKRNLTAERSTAPWLTFMEDEDMAFTEDQLRDIVSEEVEKRLTAERGRWDPRSDGTPGGPISIADHRAHLFAARAWLAARDPQPITLTDADRQAIADLVAAQLAITLDVTSNPPAA